jgi:lipoprotein-releasing system ATP-binding protein
MSSMKEPLIEAIGLQKEYRIHQNPVPVLSGIDLRIVPGEILAILGHSGVGKSTLLNLLGLLDVPTGGKIIYRGRDPRFRGQDITRLGLVDKALIRNRHLGFVFQFYHLLPDLTVHENVLLPAMIFLDQAAYRETAATFVLVTHDEELARHAHRRLRMRDGKFEDGDGPGGLV